MLRNVAIDTKTLTEHLNIDLTFKNIFKREQ